MLHVFVETNWVVDLVAPFPADTSARDLLRLAEEGRIELHLPAICLNEAKNKIAVLKDQARRHADGICNFLKAKPIGVTPPDSQVVFRVLDLYEVKNKAEIDRFEAIASSLARRAYVDVFALDDEMLGRALELTSGDFAGLQPFDQAILAGILVRAERLEKSELAVFCETDQDLWDFTKKSGQPRRFLKDVYRRARLKLHTNFDIQAFLPVN